MLQSLGLVLKGARKSVSMGGESQRVRPAMKNAYTTRKENQKSCSQSDRSKAAPGSEVAAQFMDLGTDIGHGNMQQLC